MKTASAIILLFLCFQGIAQNIATIQLGVEDGLPSSQVYNIIQDDYGYIWFSTDRGLSRYNGYEFENYENIHGLAENVVFDFVKTNDGSIWCTTISSQVFKISGREPTFTLYPYNATVKKNSENNITKGLYFSPSGDLYLSFHHRYGYLHLSSTGQVKSTPEFGNPNATERYCKVLKDDNSEPFFYNSKHSEFDILNCDSILIPNLSTSNMKQEAIHFQNSATSVYFLDNTIALQEHGIKKKTIPIKNSVIASGKLNDTLFWASFFFGGVEVYTLDGELVNPFLEDKSVSQIYIDKQKNTWISTLNNGVFIIKNDAIKIMNPVFSSDRHVHSLAKNQNDQIFVGYYDGNISKINRDKSIEAFHISNKGYPARIAHCSETNTTFFCSDKTLFSTKKKHLTDANTKYLYTHDKRLLYGISSTFILEKKRAEKTLFDRMRALDVVYFNRRYYAGNLNGLYSEKENNDGAYQRKWVLKNKRVDALSILDKKLVVATKGYGIFLLNKNDVVIANIKEDDGLCSNFISKVYSENDSTLWVCSNKGLNKLVFDKKLNYSISKMDDSDGLLSNEIWDVVVVNDTIWVGTQLGLNYFPTKDFAQSPILSSEYFLTIESISVNNEQINASSPLLNLTYDQNKIAFCFQGICFKKKLTYRYKMEGVDDEWSYTTNRRATFSSLAPGYYTFVVQVKGENSRWDLNQSKFTFAIFPPYWKTWWFTILAIAFIISLIYVFFRFRILSYNRDIVREILRQILKMLRRDNLSIRIKHNGNEVLIKTASIHFVKTSANYLEIHTTDKMYLVRSSVDNFISELPDPIEFLRVHRSYVVRLDKVQQKGTKILIVNGEEVPVGRTYLKELSKIQL